MKTQLLFLIFTIFGLSLVGGQDLETLQALEAESRANMERIAAMKEALARKAEVTKAISESPEVIAEVLGKHDLRLKNLENPGAAEETPMIQRNINAVWMVIAAMLVFFMQAGFCMLEMGLVRSKNSINVVMKNVLDISTASISYLLIGFALMFGASEGGYLGKYVWLPSFDGDSPIWTMFFFQAVFAATACTIASGAMAERTKFLGYVFYTTIFAGLIYPIFGHWAWGSAAGGLVEGFGGGAGWIEQMGFIDFAGSTVVHAIGGACALAGIIIVGPRQGRFNDKGEAVMITGHNMPLAALGTLILWLGWFGFNAGSGLAGDVSIGRIVVNTLMGAGGGCVSAMVVFWILRGTPEPGITLNGALGGLVSVTAGCAVINPGSAIVIGVLAGVLATAGAIFLEKMKLDDVAGAVPVHLFCGIWGTIAIGFFHEKGMSISLIGVQTMGALLISIGAFIAAFIIFKVVDVFVGLRASELEQEDGLDFAEHAMSAYPDFVTSDNTSSEWGTQTADIPAVSDASASPWMMAEEPFAEPVASDQKEVHTSSSPFV